MRERTLLRCDVLVCQVAEKLRKDGVDESAVVRRLADETERPKVQIIAALQGEAKWRAALEAKGHTAHGSLTKSEAHLPKYLRSKSSLGVKRAPGAGRKSYLSFLYPGVKRWFEACRSLGHWLDKSDLVLEWERLGKEYVKRAGLSDTLTVEDRLRKDAVSKKLGLIESKQRAREKFATVLMRATRCRFLKPQRVVQLSLEEEQKRAEATWKCYDMALHDVAFGTEKKRAEMFASPEQALKHSSECSLLFSDEVPFWVKIGASKQLYSETEVTRKKQHSEKPAFSQKRTRAHAESDRYRVTLECLQIVRGYFDEGREPLGEIGKSSLVLGGAHCRLSNISDNDTWIADEAFIWQGREVVRKAGQSTRGVMRAWVKLRRESEEVRRMLAAVEIYQQPAGFVDSVIMTWMIQALAREHSLSIHQRDMFSAALSSSTAQASHLSHSVLTFVAGKMTPVLQLTDTDLSFAVKRAADRVKAELRRDLRAEALKRCSEPPAFVCGPYEILRVAFGAHEHQVKLNNENQTILKGLRRNGMLSYRPSLSKGKLVRSDTQPWCQDMPEGNHRMPEHWLKHRYDWLNEDGVPQPPVWSELGPGVKAIEDMTDFVPESGEDKVHLASWSEHHELSKGVQDVSVALEADGECCELSLSLEALQENIEKTRKAFVLNKLHAVQKSEANKAQKRKERKALMRTVCSQGLRCLR